MYPKTSDLVGHMAGNSQMAQPCIFLPKSLECTVNCAISSWNCPGDAFFHQSSYNFVYVIMYAACILHIFMTVLQWSDR